MHVGIVKAGHHEMAAKMMTWVLGPLSFECGVRADSNNVPPERLVPGCRESDFRRERGRRSILCDGGYVLACVNIAIDKDRFCYRGVL